MKETIKKITKRQLFAGKLWIVSATFAMLSQTASAQINCGTPAGVLALMLGPIAVNPVDADDFQINTTVAVSCTTKLFKSPPATIPAACTNAIKMYVFYSTKQSDLTSLPSLAKSNLKELFKKPNIQATLTATSNANEKKVNVTFPNNKFTVGQKVFYRYAKLIDHPTDTDPVVWSSVLEFTTPQMNIQITLPIACTKPDLKPAPENANDILVFKITGGSWGDAAGHTYQQVSGEWCKSFFDGSGLIIAPVTGTDPSIGPMRQKTITLPPINWGVKETNNRAITTAFTNQLTRSGTSGVLATFNVTSMTANSTLMAPPFTNRGTRTVFLFEQQNKACAVRTFDAAQGHLNVEEGNYTVKVDSGNTVSECTETTTDNQKTYSNGGGNGVVFQGN